jgi:hypothetical protein
MHSQKFTRFILVMSQVLIWALVSVKHVSAQNNVTILCPEEQSTMFPIPFPGSYYHVTQYPLEPNENYQFERLNQSGTSKLIFPLSREQSLKLLLPTISPDGHYMVFRPFKKGTELIVWDTLTNEIARLELQENDINYLLYGSMNAYYSIEQDKLAWVDSHHLKIQYYNAPHETWIKSQKILTINETPFSITEGIKEDIVYPQLPIPEGNFLDSVQFSPNGNYATSMSLQRNPSGSTDFVSSIQIYDTDNETLVYHYEPSGDYYPASSPVWLPNDELAFIFLRPGNGDAAWKIIELQPEQGFQEDFNIQQAIEAAFGADAGPLGFAPVVSPSGEHIAFSIYVPNEQKSYFMIYTPSTQQIIIICNPAPDVSIRQFLPFWVPGENYFAYWGDGNAYVYGLADGSFYTLPSERIFVGWIA